MKAIFTYGLTIGFAARLALGQSFILNPPPVSLVPLSRGHTLQPEWGFTGEFIPGGNAMPAGSCDDVLEAMRNYMGQFDGDMKKQSKVKKQKKKPTEPSVNASKKAERQARKAQREKK